MPRQALPPGPRLPKPLQSMGFWTRPLAFLEGCRACYGSRFTLRLLASPPFVILSDPDEIKQVFTAPPDVLHPGEGARVLAPVVGQNSVILLDEDAHMEQRKLILPAFHGEPSSGSATWWPLWPSARSPAGPIMIRSSCIPSFRA